MMCKLRNIWIPVSLIAVWLVCSQRGIGQGSLDPPSGEPMPVMKTLDQVEPRTPINDLTAPANGEFAHVISTPGSFYLAEPLRVQKPNGILIQSPGVTLDLMGFPIIRDAGVDGGNAVEIAADASGPRIMNGSISGSFGNGIILSPGAILLSGAARDLVISGCVGVGVDLGTGEATRIEAVVVHGVGGLGIQAAIVSECVAEECGGIAIRATIATSCRGKSISGVGIQASNALNCSGASTSGTGLRASAGAVNCFGFSETGVGLSAGNATNCKAQTTSGSVALVASGTASHCDGDHLNDGVAIEARIAVACTADRGTIDVPEKHLGTP